jgi:hypothetical protein
MRENSRTSFLSSSYVAQVSPVLHLFVDGVEIELLFPHVVGEPVGGRGVHVQPVGLRRSRHLGMPVVAEHELVRQLVDRRQPRRGERLHDHVLVVERRMADVIGDELVGVALHESVVQRLGVLRRILAAEQLDVRGVDGVPRPVAHRHHVRRAVVDVERRVVVRFRLGGIGQVGLAAGQAVDALPKSEEVIEGTVLHHQDDDVIDLPLAVAAFLLRHGAILPSMKTDGAARL